MERDRNLLFGVFAVQLGKISPSQLVDVAASWATDPSRDLGERLIEIGMLSSHDEMLISNLVNQVILDHQGDASAALESFGGEAQVRVSFRESIVPGET